MENVKALLVLVLVLVLFMAANILLGVAKAGLMGAFDKESLKKGLLKALCIALAFIMMVIAGLIAPEIEMEFGGILLSTIDIIQAILIAGIVMYAGKAFINFKDVLGIDTSPEEITGTVYESIPEETEQDESVE